MRAFLNSGQALRCNVWGLYIDSLLWSKCASGDCIYGQDENWNTYAEMNTSGAVLYRMRYDPYGQLYLYDASGNEQTAAQIESYLASGNRMLFQGRRFDPETNLYYYRARLFNPQASSLYSYNSFAGPLASHPLERAAHGLFLGCSVLPVP